MADAGWYPDAAGDGSQAYWDGQRWTGDRRPAGQADQPWAGAAQGWPGGQQSGQQGGAPGEAAAEQTTRIDRSTLPPDLQAGPQGSPQGGAAGGQYDQPGQQQWYGQPQSQPQSQYPQAGQGAPTAQFPAAQDAPQGWQPGWQAPAAEQPAAGWQQPQWDQPQPKRRKRTPLIIAAVAVVVLAAGLITYLVWPDDAPSLTYNGKQIADSSKTLKTAETAVKASVKSRHGASNGDTRCYYAQPKKAPKGQKASDIDQSLRCGPVLFVDGDKSREYLSVPLSSTSASGGKVELTPSSSLGALQPQAVASDVKLNRPDGKKAPSGSGGLSVPAPPAAAANVLAVADLGPTTGPKSLGSGAVMVGRDTKVTVKAAGFIDRYGTGDDARSAPSGKKLVAFQVSYGEGDVSGTSAARPQLLVPGEAARTLPDSQDSDWIVAAVPPSGAQLQLSDGGFKQTLSLPDGKPGSNNIAVLRRTHRTSLVFKSFTVPVRLKRNDGATGNVTLHGRVSFASLDFWAPQNSSVHAVNPQNALLSVNPLFTVTGSKSTYGFDPNLIRLRVPGGRQVKPRNIASGGKIFNVFEVPASFTSGVLTVSGSEKVGDIQLSVRKAYSFTVSIQAG